jgi:hypothetical protein
MNKETLFAKIKSKPNWTSKELVPLINELESTFKSKIIPSELRVGDIIYHRVFSHPALIIKILDEKTIMCALITSNENFEHKYAKLDSRIMTNAYLTKSLFYYDNDPKSYVCTYENRLHLHTIIKQFKKIFTL